MKQTKTYAFNLAIDLIEVYVERGDTIQELKKGQLGCCDNDGFRQIGGYVNKKRYDANYIIVELRDEQKFIFKLQDVFDTIKNKEAALF